MAAIPRVGGQPAFTSSRFAVVLVAVGLAAAALAAIGRAGSPHRPFLPGCLAGPGSSSPVASSHAPSALQPRRAPRARLRHSIRHLRHLALLTTVSTPCSRLWANRRPFAPAPSRPFMFAVAAGLSLMPSPPYPLVRQPSCRWSHRGCGCLTRRCSGPGCYLVLPKCVQLATLRLPVARGSRAAERQR